MTSSRMTALALVACAALAAPAAGETPKAQAPAVEEAPKVRAPAARPAPGAKAPAADPAEPPMTVEVSYTGAAGGAMPGPVPGAPGARAAPGARRGPAADVAVSTGARGATLTLDTPGGWQGSARLAFKDAAPPMRLTLTLAKMPNYDLESLTLTSGKLALAVGPVSASPTTKYYDARGRAQKAPEGAAYTVTARRWDGELDVEVRRAPGAGLGKALTVSWRGNLGYGAASSGSSER